MNKLLGVGEEIPEFEANDFEGEPIHREDLLGAPFVIYFYPKDDTPGCTKEACEFRDLMEDFEGLNTMVIGVSPDGTKSHQKFMEKHELNFPLISDENYDIAKKFGVVKPKDEGGFSIVRSTFICDSDGVVQWVESPVSVEGHVNRVLEAIKSV